jgi:hypothetical protein
MSWILWLRRMHSSVTYINPVRTSQETHYVSTTETYLLELFRETVAVYCENNTEYNTVGRMQTGLLMLKHVVHLSLRFLFISDYYEQEIIPFHKFGSKHLIGVTVL